MYSAFLFYSLIFVGNFFLINLFLGVINYTFDKIMIEYETEELARAEKDPKVSSTTIVKQQTVFSKQTTQKKKKRSDRDKVQEESAINILDCSEMVNKQDNPQNRCEIKANEVIGAGQNETNSEIKHEEPVKTVIANSESKVAWIRLCAKLLINPYFSIVRLLATVVNTISLSMIRYPENQIESRVLFYINIFLTLFFLFENIVLIVGEGFKNYVKEIFPIFDLLLSIISSQILTADLVEVILELIAGQNLFPGSSILYTFRILRVFRLVTIVTAWKNFRILLKTAWMSLLDMKFFFILLGIYLVITSILGNQLFAYRVLFHKVTGEPIAKGST